VPSSVMKYPATRYIDLKSALKDLEPFIRKPEQLQTGRPFAQFGNMRPREMLANWLLCATIEAIDHRQLIFHGCSHPIGGDGVIEDVATSQTWPTEHVYVSQYSTGADAMMRGNPQ
jgi:hypothetical protein